MLITNAKKEKRAEFWDDKESEFIALQEDDLKNQTDEMIPQPAHEPGSLGSLLPGIEGFFTPSGLESSIFRHLHFNTDEHILRSKEDLAALDIIAEYLNSHPNVFVFIEGHCDERGAEAYNLSLGTRRSNAVRAQLVKRGVDPDRLHTISYGKERPFILGHGNEFWAKNRRAEFKLYKKP